MTVENFRGVGASRREDARGSTARGRANAHGGSAVPGRAGTRGRANALWQRVKSEEGAATAEYAVATMAAVGFAGLLVLILRGDEVREILTDLIRRALSIAP